MAKKMSKLDLCWKNCMSMWEWVAKQKKKDPTLNHYAVSSLKIKWLDKKGIKEEEIKADCFFCEYDQENDVGACHSCPGALVEESFDCENEKYHYLEEPIKFNNKLRALNRKRLKK